MNESTSLAPVGAQAIAFRSIDEVSSFAKTIAMSQFVPSAFRGKPGDVVAAIMYGLERGLSPMTSLQNIAVINGKPSVYGDLLLGMCLADPSTEYIKEADTEEIKQTNIAWCEAKRKGKEKVRRTFSHDDAKAADLLGKGTWRQYEARMLMMRARSWCLRDAFADRLQGLYAREEAQDFIDVTPVQAERSVSEPETQTTITLDEARALRGLIGMVVGQAQASAEIRQRLNMTEGSELTVKIMAERITPAFLQTLTEEYKEKLKASVEHETQDEPQPTSSETPDGTMAGPEQIDELTRLANQLGNQAEKALSDIQEVLDAYPDGLPLHSYGVVHDDLKARVKAKQSGTREALV
jgi:hypothetical protein